MAASFATALRETFRTAFIDERTAPKSTEVFELAKRRQFEEVGSLLQAHRHLWATCDHGRHTLLHWASLGGSVELVQDGLSTGACVDARANGTAQTPLMWAALGGHLSVLRLLVDAAADLRARDSKGATPLILTIQHEQEGSARLLLELGGPVLLLDRDNRGCTAGHWAAHGGSCSTLGLLGEQRADLNTLDEDGLSPLHRAAMAGQNEAIGFLVSEGYCDPTLRDHLGRDAGDIAAEKKDMASQLALLSAMMWRLLMQKSSDASGSPARHDATLAISAETSSKGNVDGMPSSCELGGPATCAPLVMAAALLLSARGGAFGSTSTRNVEDEASRVGREARDEAELEVGTGDVAVQTWDQLFEQLARQVTARLGGPPRRDTVVALLLRDRNGDIIDPFLAMHRLPVEDCCPLRVRCFRSQHVGSEDLADWKDHVDTALSAHMRCNPSFFQHSALVRAPAALRWQAWKLALDVENSYLLQGVDYWALCKGSGQWNQLIEADSDRTFKTFDQSQRQCVVRVLSAYAAYHPEVGYCQGMNMLVGFLLLVSDYREQEAFSVLVCFMHRLGLSGFYAEGMPLLCCCLRGCDRVVLETLPEIREKFSAGDAGVDHRIYLQQWLLTLFVDCLPISAAVVIWDAIVCEGSLRVALRVAIALLEGMSRPLSCMPLAEVTRALKSIRRSGSADWERRAFCLGQSLLRRAAQIPLPKLEPEGAAEFTATKEASL